MDNDHKPGAGRAIEDASEAIDRRHEDEKTTSGTGPDSARHTARDNPRSRDDSDETMANDAEEDEDDEDLEDDTEDDLDDDEDDEDDGRIPV